MPQETAGISVALIAYRILVAYNFLSVGAVPIDMITRYSNDVAICWLQYYCRVILSVGRHCTTPLRI